MPRDSRGCLAWRRYRDTRSADDPRRTHCYRQRSGRAVELEQGAARPVQPNIEFPTTRPAAPNFPL